MVKFSVAICVIICENLWLNQWRGQRSGIRDQKSAGCIEGTGT